VNNEHVTMGFRVYLTKLPSSYENVNLTLPSLWGGASCSDRKHPWRSGWRWRWPWCLTRCCYVTWGFSPVPLVTPVRTAVRRRL